VGSGCPSTQDLGPIHSWDPYIEGDLARNLGELAIENTVEVPTVIGMSAAHAEVILVAAGLTHAETAPKTTSTAGHGYFTVTRRRGLGPPEDHDSLDVCFVDCPITPDLRVGIPAIYRVSECHHFRLSTITP
jgi:hypothetical protein